MFEPNGEFLGGEAGPQRAGRTSGSVALGLSPERLHPKLAVPPQMLPTEVVRLASRQLLHGARPAIHDSEMPSCQHEGGDLITFGTGAIWRLVIAVLRKRKIIDGIVGFSRILS